MDSTRQNKISRLVQKEAASYFLTHQGDYQGVIISVTEVRVTPDLDEARIFVSIFPTEKRIRTMGKINADLKQIRFELAAKMRHQLRRIPNLLFITDETLDYAERITSLLNKDKNLNSEQ
ncbi:MAG: 30S ribosome-binding factor RbfA [Bacteroidales bacterium]|nr:30S ribosome-binding factor RbfA [Bacteroidales bacterium]MBO7142984.1 30S ribosome-binding factor RbfA [Bacteroidales bacterium]